MLNLHEPDPLARTEMSVARVGPAALVSISCPEIHEAQAEALEPAFRELIESSAGRMVLDMTSVASFSCAWINTLIHLSRICDQRHGRLVVVGLNERHRRLIRETGLTRFLTLSTSQHEALDLVGCPMVSPWRLAVARVLNIPVAPTPFAKAA